LLVGVIASSHRGQPWARVILSALDQEALDVGRVRVPIAVFHDQPERRASHQHPLSVNGRDIETRRDLFDGSRALGDS